MIESEALQPQRDAVTSILAGPVPPVVTIGGGSMEPSLMQGWMVRVVPLEGAPRPGEIVLLDTGGSLIVHRAVHVFRTKGRELLFERGDGGGKLGLIESSRVLGRVTAVLSPEGVPFPTLDRLPWPILVAYSRASRRCRALAALLAIGYVLRLDRLPLARAFGRLSVRLLVRGR